MLIQTLLPGNERATIPLLTGCNYPLKLKSLAFVIEMLNIANIIIHLEMVWGGNTLFLKKIRFRVFFWSKNGERMGQKKITTCDGILCNVYNPDIRQYNLICKVLSHKSYIVKIRNVK